MNILDLDQRFNQKPATIVVVGSINLDLSSFVREFPLPNQTIDANDSSLSAGGKGFNQAIAAARAGAKVYFVGCVGDDVAGNSAINTLVENGVDTQFIKKVDGVHTGTANIMVAEGGANMIAVSPGANHQLNTEDLADMLAILETADMLICQLECPLEVVEYALTNARSAAVTTVLNPAPAVAGAAKLIELADYVTPNEIEAMEITGSDPTEPSQRKIVSQQLNKLGAKGSVITLGPQGAYLTDMEGVSCMLSSFDVTAVNTTGAGDTFNGAFVCGMARHYSLVDSAIYASAASAISVTGKSAYDSAPTHSEILSY